LRRFDDQTRCHWTSSGFKLPARSGPHALVDEAQKMNSSSRGTDLERALDALSAAADDLPACADAAKLIAGLERVKSAIAAEHDLPESCDSLVTLAEQALTRDPWVRFLDAAKALQQVAEHR
jgi:hypothetical protein